MFLGDYDNYVTELLQPGGALDTFRPDVILIIPSNARCQYQGALTDARDKVQAQAVQSAQELLDLAQVAHERTGAEVILANFLPTSDFDPGPYRVRTLGSTWNFRKLVNLELGLNAPAYVHICDVEFLASRRGTAACTDARMWFQAKQLYSPEFSVDVAREVAGIIASLRRPMKKVLALDLDNTLWGGVIGDDGMTGIELGDTSARGQAFKAFQQSIATLAERGVLLAVCSKNDHDNAMEPFEQHPEMVLRKRDIASFQANWGPKSQSLRAIAAELNVGLDSIVFVDDNPAEIELVRQFVPEVETIQLGPDPAEYVAQLMNCRLFEPHSVTPDDLKRTEQYQQQAARSGSMGSQPDMPSYLRSLDMHCEIRAFDPVDVARIAQLINKSNQFNLTTRRRSEAEVMELLHDPKFFAFAVRMKDRFGDNGLVSVAIVEVSGRTAMIDTWLMSCRVLNRQLEDEVLNEIVRLAALRGCDTVMGFYLPTAKNSMVSNLYPNMGFRLINETPKRVSFAIAIAGYVPRPTCIQMDRKTYDSQSLVASLVRS